MTLHEYVQTLRKYWVLIAVLVVVGCATGYVVAKTQVPMFRSTSSVLLSAERGESTSELAQGSNYVQSLVQTYALLAESNLVLQPVVDELDLDTTVARLSKSVSADSPLNTAIIEISVVDSDPSRAKQINDSVVASLSSAVADVSPQDDQDQPTVRLTSINSATLPNAQFSPSSTLYAAVGGAIALLLGIVFAFVRRALSTRITDGADVAHDTAAPILGEISEARRGAPVLVSLRTNPQGLVAESFRTLSANLRFASIDRPIRSVVVTSAQPDEGKSSVAIGLAQQHAESGQRVLLIDADLRHPTVATYTQLDGTVGLTSVLLGQHDLQDAVQSWGSDTLDVLTAGTTPPNPSQLLSSSSMRLLLEQASSDYDLVVIDSAPIITVTDSLWLGNMADGMLIVVRERFTRHRHLAKAVSAVEGARAELVGVVLNRVKRGDRNSKYYTSEVESVSNIRHAVAERLGR
ncbi:hypothetical protein ASF83_08845 [Plantibacter sp. Leaf171]|uniref:polysaccharide biosynthesis tyrosine autokinase n=1 Tax=unclassified Plantibacter TaxID=2624265 RepID=UPI0006FE468D|nr:MULTISPECIES: polysaccharide biosynthesis tyrosine autokinase [unclassified Plantibacter]KQM15996.1 hypothetical protein ASE44_08860 [Plantibacter sp. Leaf1]KQR59136.1 hypothetical protein ASF83_08845 [Plantibacter sp. Leaf171]